MSKNLSRRDFLKLAGATSAGFALSACGVKAAEAPTATFIPPTITPTVILTSTATSTSTPNPSPTSTPKILTFRDITERTGTYICAIVSGDENWQSPEYVRAENEFFFRNIPSKLIYERCCL